MLLTLVEMVGMCNSVYRFSEMDPAVFEQAKQDMLNSKVYIIPGKLKQTHGSQWVMFCFSVVWIVVLWWVFVVTLIYFVLNHFL